MNFFLPYQQSWILDPARIKIMEKSRQIGISWASAYNLVRQQSIASNHLDSWVSSRDATQAQLFIQDCKRFATDLDSSCSPIKKQSSFSLLFSNQTHIYSLSSNPNAQAGKRGSRILDEFALHPDPQKLYTIAYPGITWGGNLEIISTHRGSTNFFNRLIQEVNQGGNPKKISLHRVTLEDALNQGFLRKLKENLPFDDPRQFMDNATYFDHIRSACPDKESFLQEYMCEPLDEANFFLSPSLIESCEYPPDTLWECTIPKAMRSTNDFFLGIDVGRDHDLTVFWLLENVNNILFTRQLLCLQNTPFSFQEESLHTFFSIPNLRRTCIDQTGLGRQFTERAIHHFGPSLVEGITFTNTIKESLAFALRTALENRSIRFPKNNLIRSDLRAIKRQITSSGNIRFQADRGINGHADRFWALALALHAAKNSSSRGYFSLPKPIRTFL